MSIYEETKAIENLSSASSHLSHAIKTLEDIHGRPNGAYVGDLLEKARENFTKLQEQIAARLEGSS